MTLRGLRHPPLQPSWIDRPHLQMELGDLVLESGDRIRDFTMSYVTHGDPAAGATSAVLCLPAIGSTHHRLDFLIGPGRALDPQRYFIVCVDAIGSGLTSSPSNSLLQPRLAFPRFTIRDMVWSQRDLLSRLGITKLHAVVGASMGGMQALQWGVSHPDVVGRLAALVPMARTRAWSVAVNEATRRTLMSDPGWPDGPIGAGWDCWAALVALLVGRTPLALESIDRAAIPALVTKIGDELRQYGPDAVDWVYQTWAYDDHDLGTTPGFADTRSALRAIRAPTLLMAPALDLYNPVEEAIDAASLIPNSRLVRLASPLGHSAANADSPDCALIDEALAELLRE